MFVRIWSRSKKIFSSFDGAHCPGMKALDLHDINPDFYAASCHKWMLGPKGMAFLYINKDVIGEMNPVFAGAYTDKKFVLEEKLLEYKMEASREEYGTRNTPLVMGLNAILDFLNSIGIAKIEERGKNLATYLKTGLKKIPGVEILTPDNPQYSASIVSFRISGKKNLDIQNVLSKDYHCRVRGIYEHGLNAIRISCHIYNNYEELDKLLEGVGFIAKG